MNPENCIQFRLHCDLAKAELRKLYDIVNIGIAPGKVAALSRDQLEENITILEVNYKEVGSTGHLLQDAVNSLIISLNSALSELCQQKDSAQLVSHDIPVVESVSLARKETTEVSYSLDTDASQIKLPAPRTEPSIEKENKCINADAKETPLIYNSPAPIKSNLENISENPATETDATSLRVNESDTTPSLRGNRKRIYEKIVEEILQPSPRPKKYSSQKIVIDCNAPVSAPTSQASNNISTEKSAKRKSNSFQLSSKSDSLTNSVDTQCQINLPAPSACYAQNRVTTAPLIKDSVPTMMLSSTPPIQSPNTLTSNPAIGAIGMCPAPHLQPSVIDAGGPIYGLTANAIFATAQDMTGASLTEQSNYFALLPMWQPKGLPENKTEGSDTSQLQIISYDGVWGPGFITYYQQNDWPGGYNKSINRRDSISLEAQAQPKYLCSCQQCGALMPGFIDFPDRQFYIRGGLPLPYHHLGSLQAEWPTAFFASVCGAAPQTVYLDRHGMVSIYGGRALPSDIQRTRLNEIHQVLYPWKGNGTPYSFQYETTISISVGGVITCKQRVGLVQTLQQGLVLGRDFVESHTVWVEKVDATSGWIHIDGHAFPCYRAKKAYKSLFRQQSMG